MSAVIETGCSKKDTSDADPLYSCLYFPSLYSLSYSNRYISKLTKVVIIAGILLAQNVMGENCLFIQNWREIMNFQNIILAKSLAEYTFLYEIFSPIKAYNLKEYVHRDYP